MEGTLAKGQARSGQRLPKRCTWLSNILQHQVEELVNGVELVWQTSISVAQEARVAVRHTEDAICEGTFV